MKKILCLLLVCASVMSFAGCNDNSDTTETTVPETTVAETTVADDDNKNVFTEIKDLHYYDAENGDAFAGAWQITEGTGSQYESFVYMFDGNNVATVFIGTTGSVYEYALKTEDGKEVMTTQMMFGLNGTFTYEFEGDEVTLTDIDTSDVIKMKKLASFDYIPMPKENPQLDEKLLGAWMDDSGEYYYFDENGIMYNNMYGGTFTYGTYETENGKINSTYTMIDEETDSYEYKFEGDTLYINDYAFEKIGFDELI